MVGTLRINNSALHGISAVQLLQVYYRQYTVVAKLVTVIQEDVLARVHKYPARLCADVLTAKMSQQPLKKRLLNL